MRYHPKPRLFVKDNGSTDGADRYFAKRADLFIKGKGYHGSSLDILCKQVKTPYTLVVDTDVEFMKCIYSGYLFAEKTLAICNQRKFKGVIKEKETRPGFGIHCVLFDTKKLQHLLKTFSFSHSEDGAYFYDTGDRIWYQAIESGYHIHTPKDWESRFVHYEGITGTLWANQHPSMEIEKRDKYSYIKSRLYSLRNVQHPKML